MNNNTTNLSIRVKLPEDEHREFQLQEETTILWDRVIAAVLLMSLFVGLAILAIQYWRSMKTLEVPVQLETAIQPALAQAEPIEANTAESAAEITPQQAPAPKAEASNKQVVATAAAKPAPRSQLSSAEANTLTTAEIKPAETAIDSRPSLKRPELEADKSSTLQEKNLARAENNLKKFKAPESIEAAKPPLKVGSAASVNNSAAKPAVGSTSIPSEAQAVAEVKIHSQGVNEAVLTTKVKGKTPGPKATSQLEVPSDELLTVYFVTELKGYRAKPVFFNWYRNDNRAAEVRIRPKHDLSQIMSSKYINKDMAGSWRVELVSEAGETLAESAFKVVAPKNRG